MLSEKDTQIPELSSRSATKCCSEIDDEKISTEKEDFFGGLGRTLYIKYTQTKQFSFKTPHRAKH